MTVRNIHKHNRDFVYNGAFGIQSPLIEPNITIVLQVDKDADPIVLHTIVRVHGSDGQNEFIYENEENIEVEFENESVNVDALANEVRNSVNRCFDESHNVCIGHAFPFPNVHPNLNINNIRARIEEQLN